MAVSRSHRIFLALLALALLAPQCVTEYPGPWRNHLGPATVMGADEEAYLILLNSVLLDGDLDLKNNHAQVVVGSLQGGRKNVGRVMDHHSIWYIDGQRYVWRDMVDHSRWTRDANGLPQYVFHPRFDPRLALGPEYSAHPVGLAFLLAPVLWPLRSTPYVEMGALLCAGLATVCGMLLLDRLLRRYTANENAIRLTLVAAFLATPVWYHGRSFFTEPFLVPLLLGAYVLGFRERGGFWAGLCVAAGMLMKPQLALLVPVLMVPALLRRDWLQGALVAVMPAMATGLLLWLNQHMYGSPWRGPYPFMVGNLWEGLEGLLVSRPKGLVWFAPAVLVALPGWPRLVRERPLEGGMLLAGILPSFLLVALWNDWGGGWCYGPRLIVPLLPLMAIGLVKTLELDLFQRFVPRWILANALLFGMAVNAFAAFRYWQSWHRFPVHMLAELMGALKP
ncbi:hypothetical protein BO221_15365 [Archangium sp. Cb G35]|uniref:hypothetical protein n=1 Tax=Archangium sp. Cb G35 TaxID=1920190 RepID=UPI000936AF26|nr:hypothetical protein [Archangium sp. Cb G35]OJT24527.1 hypothetical protein BO221_15365 [Archangium sp. Cb G35]